MAECSGLLNRRRATYREFESRPLRLRVAQRHYGGQRPLVFYEVNFQDLFISPMPMSVRVLFQTTYYQHL